MTPTITVVRMTGGRDRASLPLLVLGPSLGTSATTLWSACAARLTDAFDVVGWDLPGHGHNRAVPDEPVTMADLAAGVLRVVDDLLTERGQPRGPFFYAGDSVGGAVGLQLLLDAPDRLAGAAVVCSGARLGPAESWAERVEAVGASGTAGLVTASAERWFAPGFLDREPERGAALLAALADADDEGYAVVCGALAAFDVRGALGRIAVPVVAIAGTDDVAAPPEGLREVADGVAHGTYVELPGVAHLAPAEAPEEVARLLREHFLGVPAPHATTAFADDLGLLAATHTEAEVWERPELDLRSRSMVAIAALVARGDHEELAAHVRAALRNGLTVDELAEVLLQSAVHGPGPDAGAAFRVAEQVLAEEGIVQRRGLR